MKLLSDISLIGMELFKKNNENFFKSNLSKTMSKIFLAANNDIEKIDGEYYMKSGVLPNMVYYIYSENLEKLNPDKLYDVVYLNNKICIWFYTNNIIDKIDKDPLAINYIYKILLDTFMDIHPKTEFICKELRIVKEVMTVRFIYFLHETYEIMTLDECKECICNHILFKHYKKESILEYIDDIIKTYYDDNYFEDRNYLISYRLLK